MEYRRVARNGGLFLVCDQSHTTEALRSAEGLLLIAIYFVLLGHFGIALHNDLARVARKLDSDEKQDDQGT